MSRLFFLSLVLAWSSVAQSALAQSSVQGAADIPAETVVWTAEAAPNQPIKTGEHLTLQLHGAVSDGWHVYSLRQLPGGPTSLRVALDKNNVAAAAGTPTGSPPTTVHDAAFNLDTQYYTRAFTLNVPVRLAARLSGRQEIPVSVRFQTCNGPICQPPKTVHLSVPIDVQTNG